MSNSLAIAAVTTLLTEQIKSALGDFTSTGTDVTVGPPQLKREGKTNSQVNLFLYQIIPDAAWRNQDIPTKTKPGERAYPLLPLRLLYLVTVFGKEGTDDADVGDLIAHSMLGAVMLKLHNEPILLLDDLPPDVRNINEIANSELADQYEPVRLTLQPLTLDESTKLWSGFQSPYRLSVAYEASVVLIESGKPTASAQPVLSRGDSDDTGFAVTVMGGEPIIESIKGPFGLQGPRLTPAGPLNAPLPKWIPDELMLVGKNLDHPDLRLVFRHPRLNVGYIAKIAQAIEQKPDLLRVRLPHGLVVFQEDPNKSLNQIEATPPVTADADHWPVGVYTIAAARGVRIPPGKTLDRWYSTLPVAFGLIPEVKVPAANTRLKFTKTGDKYTAATLTTELASKLITRPDNTIQQTVKLFVGPTELVGEATSANGLVIIWNANEVDASRTAALIKQIPAEGRILRVQVDGVDSSLLSPPANQNSLPLREFNNKLLVTVVNL